MNSIYVLISIILICCTSVIITYLNRQCKHIYKKEKQLNIFGNGSNSKLPTNLKYVMLCEKCGDIKTVDTIK